MFDGVQRPPAPGAQRIRLSSLLRKKFALRDISPSSG